VFAASVPTSQRRRAVVIGTIGALLGIGGIGAAAAAAPHIVRASSSLGRPEANNASFSPAISADGRWVTFASDASNLVENDYNHRRDIFLREVDTGRLTRISVSDTGQQANGPSYNPSISGDGRYVAYDSFASNLVLDDDNADGDVFLYDRLARTTRLISRGLDGKPATGQSGFPVISADGNTVAFESTAPHIVAGEPTASTQVYAWDRPTGKFQRISTSYSGGPVAAGNAALSADGRFVAFASTADSVVPGDFNQAADVFVRDRRTGSTVRASVNSFGGEGNGNSINPSISADGRYVAFESTASNLLATNPTAQNLPRIPFDPTGTLEGGDTNFVSDVFVHDLITGRTTRASVASDGTEPTAESYAASISGNGRYVAFVSAAPNLVPGKTTKFREVYVHDQVTGTTTRVCQAPDGSQCDNLSTTPSIDAGGTRIAFSAEATNVVAGHRNSEADIFVRIAD
jgi:Tol biopolymer transport system component